MIPKENGLCMPFWPLLLLLTQCLITPVLAGLYGYKNTTIVNHDYDTTSEVATPISSSVFISSLATVFEMPSQTFDSSVFSGSEPTSTITITVTSIITDTAAPTAPSSSPTATSNVIRQESDPLHSVRSPPRTNDDILEQPVDPGIFLHSIGSGTSKNGIINQHSFACSNLFIGDSDFDNQNVRANFDSEPSGEGPKRLDYEDMSSDEKRMRFVTGSQGESVASFAFGPKWNYAFDCGITWLPNNWDPKTDPPHINNLVEEWETAIAEQKRKAEAHDVERKLSEDTRRRQETVIGEYEYKKRTYDWRLSLVWDKEIELTEAVELNTYMRDGLLVFNKMQQSKAAATSKAYVQAKMMFAYSKSLLDRTYATSVPYDDSDDDLPRGSGPPPADLPLQHGRSPRTGLWHGTSDANRDYLQVTDVAQASTNPVKPNADDHANANLNSSVNDNHLQATDIDQASAGGENTNAQTVHANERKNENERPRQGSPSHDGQWRRKDTRYTAGYLRRHGQHRNGSRARSSSSVRLARLQVQVVPVVRITEPSSPVTGNSAFNSEPVRRSVTPIVEPPSNLTVLEPSPDSQSTPNISVNRVNKSCTETPLIAPDVATSPITIDNAQSDDTVHVQEVASVVVSIDSRASASTDEKLELVHVPQPESPDEQVVEAIFSAPAGSSHCGTTQYAEALPTVQEQAPTPWVPPVASIFDSYTQGSRQVHGMGVTQHDSVIFEPVVSSRVVSASSFDMETESIQSLVEEEKLDIRTRQPTPILEPPENCTVAVTRAAVEDAVMEDDNVTVDAAPEHAIMIVDDADIAVQVAHLIRAFQSMWIDTVIPPATVDVLMADDIATVDAPCEPTPMAVEGTEVSVQVAHQVQALEARQTFVQTPSSPEDAAMEDAYVTVDTPCGNGPMVLDVAEVPVQVAHPPRDELAPGTFAPTGFPTTAAFDFAMPQAALSLQHLYVEPASKRLPPSFAFDSPQTADQTVTPALLTNVDPAIVQYLMERKEEDARAAALTLEQQATAKLHAQNWRKAIPSMRNVRGLPNSSIQVQPALQSFQVNEGADRVVVPASPPEQIAPASGGPGPALSAHARTRTVAALASPPAEPAVRSYGFKVPAVPEKLWNLSRLKTEQLPSPRVVDPTRPVSAPRPAKVLVSNAAPVRTSVLPSRTTTSAQVGSVQIAPAGVAPAPVAAQRPIVKAPKSASDVLWMKRRSARTIKAFSPRAVAPTVEAHPPANAIGQVDDAGGENMTYEEAAALEEVRLTANATGTASQRRLARMKQAEMSGSTTANIATMETQSTDPVTQNSTTQAGTTENNQSNSLAS
ncbi:hypothetical protein QFC22_004304 [Naganishia vaughanmartiniae]|uniref:Uncharacterized protein n=1 Tax=Naganishia vaughanmartiniae TaxID=1424756 RepID=A0ACC2X213_9TREE|nr:hypothetical protein QFC22_004304 [Naganishia vaughanmartiniae]